MPKRRESKVYNADGSVLRRIFRSHDNKKVVVVKHKRDWEAADVIIEICGCGPFNYVYDVHGEREDEFPTHKWSVKAVVKFYEELIADGYCNY